MVQNVSDQSRFELINNASNISKGSVIYKLRKTEELNMHNYYGIEIDNVNSAECAVMLRLEDSKGNVCERYMPQLLERKNLILFHEIGFSEINNLENISTIGVRIISDVHENEKNEFVSGNLLKFDDLLSLYSYREKTEYKISPQ